MESALLFFHKATSQDESLQSDCILVKVEGIYRVQIINHDPSKMHLFYRDLSVVVLLFF